MERKILTSLRVSAAAATVFAVLVLTIGLPNPGFEVSTTPDLTEGNPPLTPVVTWEQNFSLNTRAKAVVATADGGMVSAVGDISTTGFYLVKIGLSGDVLWLRHTAPDASELETVSVVEMVQTSDGGYAVLAAGRIPGGWGKTKLWLIKFSPSGAIEWQTLIRHATDNIEPHGFIETSDGNLIFTGDISGGVFPPGSCTFATTAILVEFDGTSGSLGKSVGVPFFKLDNAGKCIPYDTYGRDVIEDGGRLVLAGGINGYQENRPVWDEDPWVAFIGRSLDSNHGYSYPVRYPGQMDRRSETIDSIAVNPSGGYIAAAPGFIDCDVSVLHIGDGGTISSWTRIPGAECTSCYLSRSYRVIPDGDGAIIAGPNNKSQFWMYRVDGSGEISPASSATWQHSYGGVGLSDVARASDGGFYLVGNGIQFGSIGYFYGAYFVKTDPFGEVQCGHNDSTAVNSLPAVAPYDTRTGDNRLTLSLELSAEPAHGTVKDSVVGSTFAPVCERPTTFAASKGTSPNEVYVSWGQAYHLPGEAVLAYKVYRTDTLTPPANDAQPRYSTTGSLYRDMSNSSDAPVPGRDYYYWSRATSSNGKWLGPIAGPELGWIALSAPKNVKATDTGGAVTVTFDAVPGAGAYQIHYGSSPDSLLWFRKWDSSRTFTDTGTFYGDRYYLVRAAVNTGAYRYGPLSYPARVSRGVPAPTNVSASDGTSPAAVTVTWSRVPGIGQYLIYRSNSSSPSSATVVGTGTSLCTWNDATAQPGVKYYYWVKAKFTTTVISPLSNADSGYR